MVTIGPAVLLCLLGVTFYVGSTKVYKSLSTGIETRPASSSGGAVCDHEGDAAADNSITTTFHSTQGVFATATTNIDTSPPVPAAVGARRPVHPNTLRRRPSSVRRIFEAGAGDEADAEQVRNVNVRCLRSINSGRIGWKSYKVLVVEGVVGGRVGWWRGGGAGRGVFFRTPSVFTPSL